jgi:hypothetical protein
MVLRTLSIHIRSCYTLDVQYKYIILHNACVLLDTYKPHTMYSKVTLYTVYKVAREKKAVRAIRNCTVYLPTCPLKTGGLVTRFLLRSE